MKTMETRQVQLMFKDKDKQLTILLDDYGEEIIVLHAENVIHYNPHKLQDWIALLLKLNDILGEAERLKLQEKLLDKWFKTEIDKRRNLLDKNLQ